MMIIVQLMTPEIKAIEMMYKNTFPGIKYVSSTAVAVTTEEASTPTHGAPSRFVFQKIPGALC